MLQFNPDKRITINEALRHPYLAQFHNTKEEVTSKKVIVPPVSDNKKLNLKQYKQLIYERIKKIYS
jgi:mitogen-activated protein kinase 15